MTIGVKLFQGIFAFGFSQKKNSDLSMAASVAEPLNPFFLRCDIISPNKAIANPEIMN